DESRQGVPSKLVDAGAIWNELDLIAGRQETSSARDSGQNGGWPSRRHGGIGQVRSYRDGNDLSAKHAGIEHAACSDNAGQLNDAAEVRRDPVEKVRYEDREARLSGPIRTADVKRDAYLPPGQRGARFDQGHVACLDNRFGALQMGKSVNGSDRDPAPQ